MNISANLLLSGKADATNRKGAHTPPLERNMDYMKKILVLEDEPSIRSFVVINLRRSGYEPIEAATGEEALEKLRSVPVGVLAALAAVFAAVYLAFFALQASYLFGAFTRTVPEGYTVAEYARQGFFSLCRVMAVNFALLWLMSRTGVRPPQAQRALRALCTVLLAQSLLFAVIAASKLTLYITIYGFTPLRLQSAWLIAVLTAGCGCALYSLWSGKRSFRFWTLFSGLTLALLHLY